MKEINLTQFQITNTNVRKCIRSTNTQNIFFGHVSVTRTQSENVQRRALSKYQQTRKTTQKIQTDTSLPSTMNLPDTT